MQDGKRRYEANKEHVQTLVQEDRGDGRRFRLCSDARRLARVSY
jgi:hypothetical protein